MTTYKHTYNWFFKTTATILVCLFMVNSTLPQPSYASPIYKNLATNSMGDDEIGGRWKARRKLAADCEEIMRDPDRLCEAEEIITVYFAWQQQLLHPQEQDLIPLERYIGFLKRQELLAKELRSDDPRLQLIAKYLEEFRRQYGDIYGMAREDEAPSDGAIAKTGGEIEKVNGMELAKEVENLIRGGNLEAALSIVISHLGRDPETDRQLIFFGIDRTFFHMACKAYPVTERYGPYKRSCGNFLLRIAHHARAMHDVNILCALLRYYGKKTIGILDDIGPEVGALKVTFNTAAGILCSDNEEARTQIIERFIPLAIEALPPTSLYWDSMSYKGQVVNLFTTLATLYPNHPLLVQACRKIISFDERIQKRLQWQTRFSLPRRAVAALTGKRVESLPPAQSLLPARVAMLSSGTIQTEYPLSQATQAFIANQGETVYRRMRKEVKTFLDSWNTFVASAISAFRLMRDKALYAQNDFYHYERLETLDVHIIREAENRGLIIENADEVFIDLPIGLRIPLVKGGRETLLQTGSGQSYYTRYSLDSERIQDLFEDRFFCGLRINPGRDVNGFWDEGLIWAMIQPEFIASMNTVKANRENVINCAIRLEAIHTGLSEDEIRETYDLEELVKKWLRILGVDIGESIQVERRMLPAPQTAAHTEGEGGTPGAAQTQAGVLPHRGEGYVNDQIMKALAASIPKLIEQGKINKEDVAEFETWFNSKERTASKDVPLTARIPIGKLEDREKKAFAADFTYLRVVKLPVDKLGEIDGRPFTAHLGFNERVIWVTVGEDGLRDEKEVELDIMHESEEYSVALRYSGKRREEIPSWRDGGTDKALDFFVWAHKEAWKRVAEECERKLSSQRNILDKDEIKKLEWQIEEAKRRSKEEPTPEEIELVKKAKAGIAIVSAGGAEVLVNRLSNETNPEAIREILQALKRLDRESDYALSSSSSPYAAYRFGEDAFWSTAASAYTHRRASVVQVTEEGIGKVFLVNMQDISEQFVAALPHWIPDTYAKAGRTVLVLDSSSSATIVDVLNFAREHLTNPEEKTVNIIVSDRFRFRTDDPKLEELVKSDPELEAFVERRDGVIVAFREGAEIGRFIQGAISHFLKSVEKIPTASSARYTNLGNVLNCNPVSPLAAYMEDGPHDIPVDIPEGLSEEDTFCVGTGGGDVALNNFIALAALELSRCESPAPLRGVLEAFDGMVRDESGFEEARLPIDRARASAIFGTASTVLRSSRKNVLAVDRTTGKLKDPDSVIRMVKNLTGYTVKYTGDSSEGYMGIVLDSEATQPAHSRFRGVIVTGGNDNMGEAGKLYELAEALRIRNKYGVTFQVIAVPKSIDNDVLTQMLGYHSAAEFAAEAFGVYATKTIRQGKVLVAEFMGRAAGWLAIASAMPGEAIILIPEKAASIETIVRRVNHHIVKTGKMPAIIVSEGMVVNKNDPLMAELTERNPNIAAKLSKGPEVDEYGNIKLSGTRDFIEAVLRTFCAIRPEQIEKVDLGFITRGIPADRTDAVMSAKYAASVRKAVDEGRSGVAVTFSDDQDPHIDRARIVPIADVLPQKTLITEVDGRRLISDAELEGLGVVSDEFGPASGAAQTQAGVLPHRGEGEEAPIGSPATLLTYMHENGIFAGNPKKASEMALQRGGNDSLRNIQRELAVLRKVGLVEGNGRSGYYLMGGLTTIDIHGLIGENPELNLARPTEKQIAYISRNVINAHIRRQLISDNIPANEATAEQMRAYIDNLPPWLKNLYMRHSYDIHSAQPVLDYILQRFNITDETQRLRVEYCLARIAVAGKSGALAMMRGNLGKMEGLSSENIVNVLDMFVMPSAQIFVAAATKGRAGSVFGRIEKIFSQVAPKRITVNNVADVLYSLSRIMQASEGTPEAIDAVVAVFGTGVNEDNVVAVLTSLVEPFARISAAVETDRARANTFSEAANFIERREVILESLAVTLDSLARISEIAGEHSPAAFQAAEFILNAVTEEDEREHVIRAEAISFTPADDTIDTAANMEMLKRLGQTQEEKDRETLERYERTLKRIVGSFETVVKVRTVDLSDLFHGIGDFFEKVGVFEEDVPSALRRLAKIAEFSTEEEAAEAIRWCADEVLRYEEEDEGPEETVVSPRIINRANLLEVLDVLVEIARFAGPQTSDAFVVIGERILCKPEVTKENVLIILRQLCEIARSHRGEVPEAFQAAAADILATLPSPHRGEGEDEPPGAAQTQAGVLPHRGEGYVNDCIVKAIEASLPELIRQGRISEEDAQRFRGYLTRRQTGEDVPEDMRLPLVNKEKEESERIVIDKDTTLYVVRLPVERLGEIDGRPFTGHIGLEKGIIWVASGIRGSQRAENEKAIEMDIFHEGEEYRIALAKAREEGKTIGQIAAWCDEASEEALRFFRDAHIRAWENVAKMYDEDALRLRFQTRDLQQELEEQELGYQRRVAREGGYEARVISYQGMAHDARQLAEKARSAGIAIISEGKPQPTPLTELGEFTLEDGTECKIVPMTRENLLACGYSESAPGILDHSLAVINKRNGDIAAFLIAYEREAGEIPSVKRNHIFISRLYTESGYRRQYVAMRLFRYLGARESSYIVGTVNLANQRADNLFRLCFENIDTVRAGTMANNVYGIEASQLAANAQANILDRMIHTVDEEHNARKENFIAKARQKKREVVLIKELIPERFQRELDARRRTGLIADDISIVSIGDRDILGMLTTDGRAQDRTVLLTQELADRMGLTDENCKAQRIILDRYAAEGFSLVYLEGAIALARAVNAWDKDSVELFYRLLTGRNLVNIDSVMQAISQRRLRLEVLLPAIEIPQFEEGIKRLEDLEEEAFRLLKAA